MTTVDASDTVMVFGRLPRPRRQKVCVQAPLGECVDMTADLNGINVGATVVITIPNVWVGVRRG